VSLEMHLEPEIALNSEMHLAAVIDQVWRCIWRPESSYFGDTLEGHDRVNLEMHTEIATERVC
jgi:hypothetical protein